MNLPVVPGVRALSHPYLKDRPYKRTGEEGAVGRAMAGKARLQAKPVWVGYGDQG